MHWLLPDDYHVLIEGGPADYYFFHEDGSVDHQILGRDLANGQQLMVACPGGCHKAIIGIIISKRVCCPTPFINLNIFSAF